jgi:hypothetical protein
MTTSNPSSTPGSPRLGMYSTGTISIPSSESAAQSPRESVKDFNRDMLSSNDSGDHFPLSVTQFASNTIIYIPAQVPESVKSSPRGDAPRSASPHSPCSKLSSPTQSPHLTHIAPIIDPESPFSLDDEESNCAEVVEVAPVATPSDEVTLPDHPTGAPFPETTAEDPSHVIEPSATQNNISMVNDGDTTMEDLGNGENVITGDGPLHSSSDTDITAIPEQQVSPAGSAALTEITSYQNNQPATEVMSQEKEVNAIPETFMDEAETEQESNQIPPMASDSVVSEETSTDGVPPLGEGDAPIVLHDVDIAADSDLDNTITVREPIQSIPAIEEVESIDASNQIQAYSYISDETCSDGSPSPQEEDQPDTFIPVNSEQADITEQTTSQPITEDDQVAIGTTEAPFEERPEYNNTVYATFATIQNPTPAVHVAHQEFASYQTPRPKVKKVGFFKRLIRRIFTCGRQQA